MILRTRNLAVAGLVGITALSAPPAAATMNTSSESRPKTRMAVPAASSGTATKRARCGKKKKVQGVTFRACAYPRPDMSQGVYGHKQGSLSVYNTTDKTRSFHYGVYYRSKGRWKVCYRGFHELTPKGLFSAPCPPKKKKKYKVKAYMSFANTPTKWVKRSYPK